MATHLTIDGPSGDIQVSYTDSQCRQCAVMCHPHPLYGGSMDDACLATTEQVLLALGIDCVRFNFRGVGLSEGTHDNGIGEIDDLTAVANWLSGEAGVRNPVIGGYSFGSHVAWRAITSGLASQHLLLIAPPMGMMDFSGDADIATTIVIGSMDTFADMETIRSWRPTHTSVSELNGADHFFGGAQQDLAATLASKLAGIN